MRTLILSVMIFVSFSFISLAQNWFPLEVGNKTLQRSTAYVVGGNLRQYFLINIEKDTLADNLKYFFVQSSNYITSNKFDGQWFRYDQDSQKVYRRVLDTSVVYMDFNLSSGQQFGQYDPITHLTTLRTVIESSIQMFGNNYLIKGFAGGELSTYMRKWIDGFGVEPLGTYDKRIEQVLQFYDNDTVYFEYGYKPDFSIFTPVLETSSFNFNFDFWIKHFYTQNDFNFLVDFIESVYFDCYYSSETDSIPNGRLYSYYVYTPYPKRRIVFNLNPTLMTNGYSFYYKVTAKDKGLIPNYVSKPDAGYYRLIYDPSPVQVLFSQDSIYIPTLGDTGSVKIVNTSDHSVRIDSINSVGAFYGYRGFLSKPGFEYPFYLFQTLPSPQWNDTLGIVIPPHDSVNVSFYEVDLCPICDYEVQEYFNDTLRFVFTFMDGNVYSFSKSIPISGEGHPSDVKDENVLPTEFALNQNFPNPFNSSTKISWQSPVSSWQTIKVYDVLGNEVVTLVNEYRDAGNYETEFNAEKLSSGVYYYQLRAGSFVETRKMIYLK